MHGTEKSRVYLFPRSVNVAVAVRCIEWIGLRNVPELARYGDLHVGCSASGSKDHLSHTERRMPDTESEIRRPSPSSARELVAVG
ncbi:hypothetical protein BMS3Bbin02_01489 [bacterium BMS3Bbin02]|nr:hypothetical protein BMS3Bbin02_01489 [bacterium BMS3Bbin02]